MITYGMIIAKHLANLASDSTLDAIAGFYPKLQKAEEAKDRHEYIAIFTHYIHVRRPFYDAEKRLDTLCVQMRKEAGRRR